MRKRRNMKIFKKFLAALIAAVMAFAVMAFAACDSGSKDPTDPGNGGTNNGGGTETKTPAELLLSAVEAATSYIEISANSETESTEVIYTASSPTAQKPETAESAQSAEKYEFSGKADLKSGNADVQLNVTFSSGDESEKYIEYYFLRNWNSFSCSAAPDEDGNVTEITDFSKAELEYGGDYNETLNDYIKDIIGGDVGGGMPATDASQSEIDLGNLTGPAFMGVNSFAVNLAVAAGTLEVNGGVYTVDFIKTLNKIWSDISAVVTALDENTTVGDLLANGTVKKYVSLITELVPAQTLYDIICEAVEGQNSQVQLMLAFLQEIKPDKDSTTYDYIVKLVKSNGFKVLLNNLFKAQGAPSDVFVTTVDQTKLGDLLALFDMNLDGVKAMLDKLPFEISDSKLTIKTDGKEIVYNQLKLGYTLKDGKLTDQSISVSYDSNSKKIRPNINVGDEEVTYEITEITQSVETSTSWSYVESAATLTDIGGCTVVKYEEWNGYVDGENGCELRFDPGYYDDDNYWYNGNSVCLNVTPQVDAQGNVTGLYVDGDKENPVVNGGTYTLNMEVEVFNYATNERTTEKVDFIIVFLMENYDYEYMIEINTDGNVRMDNGYFVKQYEYLAYNSNVAKILAGTPDWHLAG